MSRLHQVPSYIKDSGNCRQSVNATLLKTGRSCLAFCTALMGSEECYNIVMNLARCKASCRPFRRFVVIMLLSGALPTI